MEHAIYSACQKDRTPGKVMARLALGQDPEVPAGALIRLRDIETVELSCPEELEIIVQHRTGGRRKRRHVVFGSVADRQAFLDAIQERLGEQFTGQVVDVPWPRAVLAPGLCLLAVCVLGCGAAWLASYWRAFPPPPPVGKAQQDELVRLLTWAGPQGVMLAAAVPFVLLSGWLMLRSLRPPRVYCLALSLAGLTQCDPSVTSETEKFTDLRAAEASVERSRRRNDRVIRFLKWLQVPLIIAAVACFVCMICLWHGKIAEQDLRSARKRSTVTSRKCERRCAPAKPGRSSTGSFLKSMPNSFDKRRPKKQRHTSDPWESWRMDHERSGQQSQRGSAWVLCLADQPGSPGLVAAAGGGRAFGRPSRNGDSCHYRAANTRGNPGMTEIAATKWRAPVSGSPKGVRCDSPGRSPGGNARHDPEAPKGRRYMDGRP